MILTLFKDFNLLSYFSFKILIFYQKWFSGALRTTPHFLHLFYETDKNVADVNKNSNPLNY